MRETQIDMSESSEARVCRIVRGSVMSATLRQTWKHDEGKSNSCWGKDARPHASVQDPHPKKKW